MSEQLQEFQWIEDYILGRLVGDELAAFEERRKTDPGFEEKVMEVERLIGLVEYSGEKDLRKKIRFIKDKLKKEDFFTKSPSKLIHMEDQKRKSAPRWLYLVAAVMLLAIAAIFIFQKQNPFPDAFAKYYKADDVNVPVLLDRLEASGFANPETGAKDSLLTLALHRYERGEYQNVRDRLQAIVKDYPEDKIAATYLGLTLLQLSQYSKAVEILQPIAMEDGFELQNMAKWYLALSYTMLDEETSKNNARTLFEQLVTTEEYRQQAENYLELFTKN